MSWKELFETGVVVATAVWKNLNSNKDQVTLQVHQKKDNPSANTNRLVSIAQGGSAGGRATALHPFKREVFEGLFGVEVPEDGSQYSFRDEDVAVDVSEVLGFPVNIKVTENFDKNEYGPDGEVVRELEPKINPNTEEVLKKDGKEIYRHTELVDGPANDIFIQHDREGSTRHEEPAKEKAEVLDQGAN